MVNLQFEMIGQVGLITINRPESLNAINSAVLSELAETLDTVDF